MPFKSRLRPGSICRLNEAAYQNRLMPLNAVLASPDKGVGTFFDLEVPYINVGEVCIFLDMHIVAVPLDDWQLKHEYESIALADIWASVLLDEKVLAWKIVTGTASGLRLKSPDSVKTKWLMQAATNFKVFFDVVMK